MCSLTISERRSPRHGNLSAVTPNRSGSALERAYPGGKRIAKRTIDAVLAIAALALLAPLMLVIAAAIKLDDGGAVLSRQKRRDFEGRFFSVYKFRTIPICSDFPEARRALPAWAACSRGRASSSCRSSSMW